MYPLRKMEKKTYIAYRKTQKQQTFCQKILKAQHNFAVFLKYYWGKKSIRILYLVKMSLKNERPTKTENHC